MRKTTDKKNNKRTTIICGIAILIMGVIYQLPMIRVSGIPLYPYEDGVFHMSRIIGLGNVWRSPVSFLNFHHNGLAVNLCYPWLTIYPAWILFSILGSCINACKAFYLLLTLVTLFLAYGVMHSISGNRLSAFIFAVLYTYSSYRFENMYHRSAMGEVTAITLWLLVFIGLYHVYFGNFRKWGYLAAGMALLSYTHNLSLLIAVLVTGLTFLVSIWFWDKKKQRILSLFYAGVTAVLLSLGSLLPMVELFRTNTLQIPGGTGLSLQRSVFSLPTLLGKMLRNETSAHSVGLIVFSALVILCLFFGISRLKKQTVRRGKGIDLFLLTGVLVLFMVSDLLPWEWIGDHSFLRQLQFVWRLNICPTLFILAAFAFYLPQMLKSIRSQKAVLLIPLLICTAAVGIHYRTFLVLFRQDHTRIFEEYAVSGEAASMDYAPLQAKQYRDETHLPSLDGIILPEGNTEVPAEISFSDDGSVYMAVINSPGKGNSTLTVDIPVFWYTTQQCTVNGKQVLTALSRRGGTLVEIPAGQTNEIRIFYQYTALANIFHAISGIAAMLFLCLQIRYFRKHR